MYDREILRGLAELGAELELPLMRNLEHPAVLNWNVHPIEWRRLMGLDGTIPNVLFLREMNLIWRSQPFDVLRIFELRFVGWAALAMRAATGICTVFHVHHLESGQNMSPIDAWLARRCDGFTTDSHYSKREAVARYGVSPEAGFVIYAGVSPCYQPIEIDHERLRSKYELGASAVLLYLGPLIPRKNLLLLLDTLSSLVARGWDIALILCGEERSGDTYPQILRLQTEKLGLGTRVIFAGRADEDEKIALYNLADIFVFPSLLEGFGMAAAEAMACGKPVVAAHASSLPEVVEDGKTGFLAAPSQAEEFAVAIDRLLREPELAQLMGARGRRRVLDNFTWERAAKHTLDAYQAILRRKKSDARTRK